jgi:hypothetical protein
MNKRLKLKFWDRVWHQFFTIVLAVIGLFFLVISYYQPTENVSPATMSPESLVITGLGLFGLATLTYFWLETKLNFATIDITFDRQTAIEVIIETAKKNEWLLKKELTLDSKIVELIKSNLFATPNDIVIKLEDKTILINARGNYPTDQKIVDKIITALRMKGYEMDHQKKQELKKSQPPT